MIARSVKIQLLIFALISAIGVVYTGFAYVGIRGIGPLRIIPGPFTVTVQLSDSGGIFTGAEVTERGVIVGRVGSLTLDPRTRGVDVKLKINHGTKIPSDVTAAVADLSAVGEQYIDLTPQSTGAPYLSGHSAPIPISRTSIPVNDATLLSNLDKLVNSVDRKNLATTITELGKAFDNTGPDLQRLITQGNLLLASAQQALPQTLTLIDDGKVVLGTQNALNGDLQSFAGNLDLLSQQLVTSDPSIRALFANGTTAAATLQQVLQANEADLPTVLRNLVTLGQIGEARLPGIEQTLILYPLNVANGFLGARNGVAQFGLVTTQTPVDCTSGYGSTKVRSENPKNPAYGLGGGANENTLCTSPDQAGEGGSSEARGAATAPRPAGDTSGQPGGAVGTSRSGKANYAVTAYDPATGTFTGPDGHVYQNSDDSVLSAAFGADSWQWLLASPASD